jgi:penicillin-binding protein 2
MKSAVALAFSGVFAAASLCAQQTKPADATLAPTWETQKHARTYLFGIPAPRGQIVDRNGAPLAQSRVSYNLAVAFPTPPTLGDREALTFAQHEVTRAGRLIGRPITLNAEGCLKHYRNRAVLPFVIAQDLRPGELDAFRRSKPEHLVLQPVYQRIYPSGSLAAHIVGYAGRAGRTPDGPIENNELLWPNSEGREGIEDTFDEQLQGKTGLYNISFDAQGRRASEQVTIPPQPGYNVVTTLDLRIQQIVEETLAHGCKRGAMVIVDPNTGDVLAMASCPTFNPNLFIPRISEADFKALNDDPNLPLLPRAFRSAYPPGSTFKVIVGVAALQSGRIDIEDEFSCPPSMEIGGLTFRNWKRSDGGHMAFRMALTQSCDTWFYQVGIKIGARPILDFAQQFGFGQRTGLPLASESAGLLPSDEHMLRVHKRKILNGDVANLSIGQGDLTSTPLQMAMAMGAVGNGGTLYAARLVQQVQTIDNQIVTGYDVRARTLVDMDKAIIKEMRRAMTDVVASSAGTAGKASVPGVAVAGKTGTAQWGPKHAERTAAWFAGFAPANKPKYAFSVVYETDVKNADDVHGGTAAAPLIGKVMRQLFKDEPKEKKTKRTPRKDDVDEDAPPVRKAKPADDDGQ